jgi:hypothetical protein
MNVQRSIEIDRLGTITLLRPRTKRARRWLDRNCATEPWQWLGGALCVEPRLAAAIIEGLAEA